MLIQEEHGFSVKASIHISFPGIVPRTPTIFPAHWSGCWYRSQRVASIGCVLACAQLEAQKLRRKTAAYTRDTISFILGSPVAGVVGPDAIRHLFAHKLCRFPADAGTGRNLT